MRNDIAAKGVKYEGAYLHPDSEEIRDFVRRLKGDAAAAEEILTALLRWFDDNVGYSRLDSPFEPLQRSDTDLLRMKSGTCGDYSNLIVSVLLALGIPARYAYLKRDCYGDEQDHICAAAFLDGRWVLIDATLPYRRWHGFDCPHQEYELLEPEEFEKRMKRIEAECIQESLKLGDTRYAGILYAPWIHDEVVLSTDERLDSVFYLLMLNRPDDWKIYINYLSYTRSRGETPVMAVVTPETEEYRFSVRRPKSIWDEEQWGGAFSSAHIPEGYQTEELRRMRESVERNVPAILQRVGLTG